MELESRTVREVSQSKGIIIGSHPCGIEEINKPVVGVGKRQKAENGLWTVEDERVVTRGDGVGGGDEHGVACGLLTHHVLYP